MSFKKYVHNGITYNYIDDIYSKKHYQKLLQDDKDREFFVKNICELLNIDDPYDIKYLTDRINNYAEFDIIISCIEGSSWIKDIPEKDKKHEHRKKEKFIKARNEFILECKKIGLTHEANNLLKINYTPYEIFTNYQDVIKKQKDKLYQELHYTLNIPVGKKRANELTKILNYL